MTLRMALLLIVTVAEAVNNQWRVVHERRRLVAPISEEAQNRRTLERFTKGHPDNSICWDRDGLDGFVRGIATGAMSCILLPIAALLETGALVCLDCLDCT